MRGPVHRPWSIFVALLVMGIATPACGQEVESAQEAWRDGQYADAAAAYEELAAAPGAPPSVHRERARLLAEMGRYDDAEQALRSHMTGAAAAELQGALGEVLLLRGRLADAEAAFQQAVDAEASDWATAGLNLGVLQWRRGERDQAYRVFDTYIDLYNDARERLSAEELAAVGEAVRYLSTRDSDLVQDALLAYDRAAERDPGDPRPKLLAGELFLAKYQAPDAHASFDEVLQRNAEHPRALLGKARVLDFDGNDAEAMALVTQALETNPNYTEARTFLARLHIKLEEYEAARTELERALEVNAASLEALSVLAALHNLTGNTAEYELATQRALALNPRNGDLYATVAELAVDHRKYQAGVELAQQAVALDSTSWWGWGILGVNQLRIGLIEEGRRNVERAFAGDPHNVWLYNTLELTDTFERYRTVRTPHFELFLREDEADLLAPYVERVAEQAYAALVARYGAEPPTPVRLELFPSHGDFSVRTLGLTGLGALGVSFGSVLVMDSPSAREPGEFNWASTLWHELAHAFHLAMTEHKVPRWFSEGLAVYEQRLAQRRWGFHAGVGFLQAYQAEKLHPVSVLNRGFVRPDYPEQVMYSYLQASLVFEMIEGKHGVQATLAMLNGYREGRSTEELVQSVLGTTPEALDEEFDAYMRSRYGSVLPAVFPLEEPLPPNAPLDALREQARRNPGDFSARLVLGQKLFQDDQIEEAEEELRAALTLFPDYGGPDSPYLYLARIHRGRGETDKAAAAFLALAERSENAYEALLEEAELRRQLQDSRGEITALERALEAYPYEVRTHERLAELHTSLGDPAGAVRERAAVLALAPVDKARAHYELALAHLDAGDPAAARRETLRALEIAPGYPEAQDLLLRLQGAAR